MNHAAIWPRPTCPHDRAQVGVRYISIHTTMAWPCRLHGSIFCFRPRSFGSFHSADAHSPGYGYVWVEVGVITRISWIRRKFSIQFIIDIHTVRVLLPAGTIAERIGRSGRVLGPARPVESQQQAEHMGHADHRHLRLHARNGTS